MESNEEDALRNQVAKSEADKSEVPLQNLAEGSVEGQIACIDGPVKNATVSIGMISAFSDAKGNFLIEHVPPGIGKIRVKPPVSKFYDYSQDVLIEANNRKKLFIFLTEITGTVEGTVSDETGKPLVGAEISGLFRLGKSETSKTDENGHYIFNEVPRGVYYIRARAQGFMTEGADVNATGGNTALSNFTLKAASLSITGKVLSKEGTAIDSDIYLMRKGIVVTKVKTITTSGGSFAFTDLIPDNYEIEVLCSGYDGKGWSGKLEKSEVVNFVVEKTKASTKSSAFHH